MFNPKSFERKRPKWDIGVNTKTKPDRTYVPGENYKPVSKYKSFLRSYLVKPEPKRTVIVECNVCDCPYKKEVVPPKKKHHYEVAENAWIPRSERKPINSQRVQLFDNWWKRIITPETGGKVPRPHRHMRRKPIDHHLYHHKPLEAKKNSTAVKQQITICVDCPDPHRSWLRGKPHLYNPSKVQYPLTMDARVQAKPRYPKLLVNLCNIKKEINAVTNYEKAAILRRQSIQLRESLAHILLKIHTRHHY